MCDLEHDKDEQVHSEPWVPLTCGFGAEVVAWLQQECLFQLDAPIQHVWKNFNTIHGAMDFCKYVGGSCSYQSEVFLVVLASLSKRDDEL